MEQLLSVLRRIASWPFLCTSPVSVWPFFLFSSVNCSTKRCPIDFLCPSCLSHLLKLTKVNCKIYISKLSIQFRPQKVIVVLGQASPQQGEESQTSCHFCPAFSPANKWYTPVKQFNPFNHYCWTIQLIPTSNSPPPHIPEFHFIFPPPCCLCSASCPDGLLFPARKGTFPSNRSSSGRASCIPPGGHGSWSQGLPAGLFHSLQLWWK